MTINKRPTKENYENLITRIYEAIDNYIKRKNDTEWDENSKWILHGMWQLADSIKNQIIIARDVDGIKTDVDLEKKVEGYEKKLNELGIL